VTEKIGWLEACKPGGTVFLDEIGELDPAIQVKLLRVLEMRGFQRLGETRERVFSGKIVAATHRDLRERIRAGEFREDLYYRLCADLVETPSLREQLDDAPEERGALVRHLAAGAAGAAEAEGLAREVETWIDANLPADYPWPGNVRELGQCVRNVMVRGSYSPLARGGANEEEEDFGGEVGKGTLSADEVLRRYATLVQAQTGNYRETAERLGIHRNTVARRVDPVLLAKLVRRRGRGGAGG
jgi:DNA-binding NtrC family response regulator